MAQYFNLTLDTAAPSNGILSGLASYYNNTATVTISADGAAYMKVWTNQNAVGATSDTAIPSDWEAYNTSKTVSFTGQGTQYVHAIFMDNVGNVGSVVNSSSTIYDNVAPIVSSVVINSGDAYTTSRNITLRVSFSDATAGVKELHISGDLYYGPSGGVEIIESVDAADVAAGYKDISLTLSTNDGLKTVSVQAVDKADNISSSVSDTITLDTTAASATLVLRKADDSANLPAYVNSRNYIAKIITEDTDIASYKFWEGDTEPQEWTAYAGNIVEECSTCEGTGTYNESECETCGGTGSITTASMALTNCQFSSGDGAKVINVKLKDSAGNITTLTPITIVLDTVAPTVTLSANPTAISSVSGHNTVTFTCGATDTNSAQGFNYVLKLGGTAIKSGVFANSVAVTQAEIEEISAGQGTKSFTLEVTDIAGNTGTSSACSVILDKTAPTGSIAVDSYYNSSTITATISGSDTGGAGMQTMKLYLDGNEYDRCPYGSSAVFYPLSEGTHTVGVKFIDRAGNESTIYTSSQFIVDTTAPVGTISTSQYTNNRTITININVSDSKNGVDATSGVGYMKIWEDGQAEPSSWEAYAITKSLTLSEGNDGMRTINAKFKDNAGNATTTAVTYSTILDLDEPDAVLALLKSNGSNLPAKVNTTEFQVRISHTAPDTAPIVQYKLSGDFTAASNEWQTFTYDLNQTYMTISNLNLTSGNGLKTITVQLKDEAGNESSAVNATVIYDTTPPVIDVQSPDYNIVSNLHTPRLNSSGTVVSGKYNDMCIFTWSANEALAAFKVCVNQSNQTAASAVPIGTTYGSLNMSGSSVAANTTITSTIFGADLAATSAVNDTDGAYEIIVYGQDEGGTWSAVHAMDDFVVGFDDL